MSTSVKHVAITIEGGRVVVRFADVDLCIDPSVALDFAQKLAATAATAMGAEVAREALAAASSRADDGGDHG